MNILFYKDFQVIPIRLINKLYYHENGYLQKYAIIRRELGACVRGLGTHLSKEVAFTF